MTGTTSSHARRALISIFSVLALLAGGSGAQAAEPPIKLIVERQYGAKVNVNESSVCTESECKPTGAQASTAPGGFAEFSPAAIAVNDDPASPSFGNIYVADRPNQRVQELTPKGEFVLMFGREVNETTHGDICTQQEIETDGVRCKAGVAGAQAGAFSEPEDISVDADNGNVYIRERDHRVDEYTATGDFILMIGKGVDETTHGNLCTAVSGDVCGAGKAASQGSVEHGAFSELEFGAHAVAAGGPNDLLYVGDEHRVQEFASNGTWVHDLTLTQLSADPGSRVFALTLDHTNGDLHLVYNPDKLNVPLRRTIVTFDAVDKQIGEAVLKPREAGAYMEIEDLATDAAGHIGVVQFERQPFFGGASNWLGMLLDDNSAKQITSFSIPAGGTAGNAISGLAFNSATGESERMYAGANRRKEVVGYGAKIVGEPVTGAITCEREAERETLITMKCHLHGTLNPEKVENTEATFLWSTVEEALHGPETLETTRQPICTNPCGETPVPVESDVLRGLVPNATIYYEIAGYDLYVPYTSPPPFPEPLSGEERSPATPMVSPKILAQSVSFVKSSSVVMMGELDPEHAKTEYFFEYGSPEALEACPKGVRVEGCTNVGSTQALESEEYGRVAATLEATGLQPGSEYAYRLSAASESRDGSEKRTDVGTAARFTTAPSPKPTAETGPVSMIGTTSVTVSGRVNPDGQAAVYRFELGVDEGPATQYTVVASHSTGKSSEPLEEQLLLTGLQPGTKYAVRISIQSGFAQATGATVTFTTTGLLAALPVPPMLAQLSIPRIQFPENSSEARLKGLTRAQKRARAIRACKKKPQKLRAVCERHARKKYGVGTNRNKRR